MQVPIKLRTRLFLSISALISVALLGLLLGLISVMQMTNNQQELIQRGFAIVDVGQQLRQALGEQLTSVIDDEPDPGALRHGQQRFRQVLDDALRLPLSAVARRELEEIDRLYRDFEAVLATAGASPTHMGSNDDFTATFSALREHMLAAQNRAFQAIGEAAQHARERSLLIAALLGLIGFAVLLIGFVTAHSIARRFGAPIDLLARAADQIGQGNYQVTLPLSSVAELAVLSRRFGLMAEALNRHHSSNIHRLQSSEGRLQAVLDSIDDGLVILDSHGCIEHANPVAIRQLFWQSDPHGQPIARLLAPDSGVHEAVRRVLAGELLEQAPDDLRIDSAGEPRLVAWSLTPIQPSPGLQPSAVMVLRDVTEQRLFERVRSEFVLRASHELRTPVTGMHMAFSLLRERQQVAEGSREQDLMRTVAEEMQRLVRLIDDLLDFSRYQNGLHPLQRAPCLLDELLQQAGQRFAEAAGRRRIVLRSDVQGELPAIDLDRTQIERVLDNLINNALRHSEDGGEVQLQARRHGERVILSVLDQGEGIPISQQARIFEPFVQVGRRKGGVGLGLALSREIVQLHGGRLDVHSRPGQGAHFYISLPLLSACGTPAPGGPAPRNACRSA